MLQCQETVLFEGIVDSDSDTVVYEKLDLFDKIYIYRDHPLDFNKVLDRDIYCKTIAYSSDEEITKFYDDFSPNYAIPMLQYGCSLDTFNRMFGYIKGYPNSVLNVLLDDLQFHHIHGYFYTHVMDNANKNRYCDDCIDEISPSNESVNTFYMHCLNVNVMSVLVNINNDESDYFCSRCNRFLYVVISSDNNQCSECEEFIIYDNKVDKIPCQFFTNDICYYKSCPTAFARD